MPHATFGTPLGTCAIAWSDTGVTRFLLPDPERIVSTDTESTPPPWIAAIIERVKLHLSGTPQDFANVRFDFGKMPDFTCAVLQATLAVKSGCTSTYGEIAAAIGQPPVASRAVGAALGANPIPLLIPCHRIVAASGQMTGFSGPGGVATKAKLLALEGARLL